MGKCLSSVPGDVIEEIILNHIDEAGEFHEIPGEAITKDDCQKFILTVKFGRVVDVYDSDTITISAYRKVNDQEPILYKFKCRILFNC